MRYTGLLAIFYLLLAACEIKPGTAPKADTIKKVSVTVPDTLYSTRKLHTFSDPAKLDTFRLDVLGAGYLSARAKIQIVSAAGILIYLEEFNTADLAEYGIKRDETDSILPTEKEKLAHIEKRLKGFFDSDRFSSPAIKPGTPLLPDRITNQELISELRLNSKSTAFHYVLGLDSGVNIAYSEKFGKAVVFYSGIPSKEK